MSSLLTRIRITITIWIFGLLLAINNLKVARFLFGLATKPKSPKSWAKVDPQEKTILWVTEGAASLKQEELNDRVRNADIVLFWAHGGGTVFGCAAQNTDVFVDWIKMMKEKKNIKLVVCAIEYRLAPENPAPAQMEDVAAAYSYLLNKLNLDPKKIIMGGDSAAGLLIPDTIVYNHLYKHVLPGFPEEFPTPAGYVFSSPVSSTLDDCPSVTENAKKDFNSNGVDWVKIYFQSPNRFEPQPWAFLKTEKLSVHIPKRVLVYVGGHELKRDENILVADTFRNAGADTTMVREEYVHNWFLLKDAVVDEPSVIERAQETFADWLIKTVQQA
ncbi:hypothetical protein Unana1_00138 [Umbelopsis nana]